MTCINSLFQVKFLNYTIFASHFPSFCFLHKCIWRTMLLYVVILKGLPLYTYKLCVCLSSKLRKPRVPFSLPIASHRSSRTGIIIIISWSWSCCRAVCYLLLWWCGHVNARSSLFSCSIKNNIPFSAVPFPNRRNILSSVVCSLYT